MQCFFIASLLVFGAEIQSVDSGENVLMSAGNDLNVCGSQVIANKDLIGLASNNINISASEDVSMFVSSNSSRKTGIMGSVKVHLALLLMNANLRPSLNLCSYQCVNPTYHGGIRD